MHSCIYFKYLLNFKLIPRQHLLSNNILWLRDREMHFFERRQVLGKNCGFARDQNPIIL